MERRNLLAAGFFYDSLQSLGEEGRAIALGDIDGDSDLDALTDDNGVKVWLNDGSGNFVNSGHISANVYLDMKLGYLNGDGYLDAAFSDGTVWWNDGSGNFTDSGQSLGTESPAAIEIGDLDNDGDFDLFFANQYYENLRADHKDTHFNTVWLNDGNGIFTDSGLRLGNGVSYDVALGYLDGDEYLDAYVANHGRLLTPDKDEPDRVWFNQGVDENGQWLGFVDSGQEIGLGEGLEPGLDLYSAAVSLADLDGDTDLDAFVVRGHEGYPDQTEQPDLVWLNDGNGFFSDSGLRLGSALRDGADRGWGLAVGDVNGDGYSDAFVANRTDAGHPDSTSVLWINQGVDEDGAWLGFDFSGQEVDLTPGFVQAPALGDLDGDNDLDLFLGVRGGPSRVFFNGDPPAPSFAIDDVFVEEGDSGTTVATFTVTRSGRLDVAVSVDYATENGSATSGSPTLPDDYSAIGLTTLDFDEGQTSKTINVTIIGDTLDEGDHQFYVNLSNATGGATISDNQGVGTILDDDAPVAPTIHVADLDATSTPGSRGKWDATVTVTVVDSLGQVRAGVTVTGFWSDDPSTAVKVTTEASGMVTITRSNINKKTSSLTFTVSNLSLNSYVYDPLANEDEDGDSDGTQIVVGQP